MFCQPTAILLLLNSTAISQGYCQTQLNCKGFLFTANAHMSVRKTPRVTLFTSIASIADTLQRAAPWLPLDCVHDPEALSGYGGTGKECQEKTCRTEKHLSLVCSFINFASLHTQSTLKQTNFPVNRGEFSKILRCLSRNQLSWLLFYKQNQISPNYKHFLALNGVNLRMQALIRSSACSTNAKLLMQRRRCPCLLSLALPESLGPPLQNSVWPASLRTNETLLRALLTNKSRDGQRRGRLPSIDICLI